MAGQITSFSAASDLGELQNAAGATGAAFEKMKDEAGNQMTLLANNIQAALRPMGEAILEEVADVAKSVNRAFENEDAKEAMRSLGDEKVTLPLFERGQGVCHLYTFRPALVKSPLFACLSSC